MRWMVISLAAVTSAAVTACSGAGATSVAGGPASAKPAKTAVTAPQSARSASPIEGTWRSAKLTEPEFVRWYEAAGGKAEDGSGNPYPTITAAGKAFFAQLGNGARRYAVITIRFQSGQFAEFESGNGRPAVNGDTETYTISGNRLNMMGTGPFACTATYIFRITGRMLRLHVLKHCPSFESAFGTTLYASFPFTKVS